MQTKQFNATAPKLSRLQELSVIVQTGTVAEISAAVASIASDPMFSGKGWQASFAKLAQTIATGVPSFALFAMGGNVKLPFIAWSTLPGVTCPGAGDCLQWCYSFRAHRYPAAYARQAQNAFLQRFHPETIAAAFRDISAGRPDGFEFRLYVDGDFDSVETVAFWADLLRSVPTARAYGYSKSFALLLQAHAAGHVMPENYQLNLSGGHNADAETYAAIVELPMSRGAFLAIPIGRKVKSTDHGTVETNAAVRAAAAAMGIGKVFPCPGQCGSCTGKGHACGLPQLKGITIAIAVH